MGTASGHFVTMSIMVRMYCLPWDGGNGPTISMCRCWNRPTFSNYCWCLCIWRRTFAFWYCLQALARCLASLNMLGQKNQTPGSANWWTILKAAALNWTGTYGRCLPSTVSQCSSMVVPGIATRFRLKLVCCCYNNVCNFSSLCCAFIQSSWSIVQGALICSIRELWQHICWERWCRKTRLITIEWLWRCFRIRLGVILNSAILPPLVGFPRPFLIFLYASRKMGT